MVVKVYGEVKAVCPQRVLACLLEKGIDFEIIPVDLEAGEQKKPEFLVRQPFGQVPAVEDGDFRLYESRAIARYYARKYPEQGPNLLGKTLEQKALVDQWTDIEAINFNPLVQPIVIHTVIMPRTGRANPGPDTCRRIEELKGKLEKVLDVYEERLGKSRYLAGEEFTLADLTHMPAMRYLVEEVVEMRHVVMMGRTNLKRWWDDVSSRTAWNQLMNIAGIH